MRKIRQKLQLRQEGLTDPVTEFVHLHSGRINAQCFCHFHDQRLPGCDDGSQKRQPVGKQHVFGGEITVSHQTPHISGPHLFHDEAQKGQIFRPFFHEITCQDQPVHPVAISAFLQQLLIYREIAMNIGYHDLPGFRICQLRQGMNHN